MDEQKLECWEDFLAAAKAERDEYKARRADSAFSVSSLLFRGQANSCWNLETTLEREGDAYKNLPFWEYHRRILLAKSPLEAFTGFQWDPDKVPSHETFRDRMEKWDGQKPLPGSEYIAYLRHHGFPSPFLDWTRSAYIAAYFAFAGVAPLDGRVAIFMYCENPGTGGKAVPPKQPRIRSIGLNIATHRRHFLQQCEYTYCCKPSSDTPPQWCYASHEAVFKRGFKAQDVIKKFTIPANERLKVLLYLDEVNINAFSLLGSEDSLISSLAVRQFPF